MPVLLECNNFESDNVWAARVCAPPDPLLFSCCGDSRLCVLLTPPAPPPIPAPVPTPYINQKTRYRNGSILFIIVFGGTNQSSLWIVLTLL